MDPRLPRILALGLAATLAAGLLLWDSITSGGGFSSAMLVPPVLILLFGLALVLRARRREDPSGTPRRAVPVAARVAGALIGALVALGAVLWDRSHDAGGVSAGSTDGLAPLLVLGVIVLLGVLMLLVKRMKEDRNQRPR